MLNLTSVNMLAVVLDLTHVDCFFFSDGSGFGKNIMILGADMRSLVHIDNKKKDLLIFGKNAAESLDDTVLTEDKENFTEQQKKF